MKKNMISLMMVVAATTTSFAKSNNTDVANAVKSVGEQVKQAPSGTVYGVAEKHQAPHHRCYSFRKIRHRKEGWQRQLYGYIGKTGIIEEWRL